MPQTREAFDRLQVRPARQHTNTGPRSTAEESISVQARSSSPSLPADAIVASHRQLYNNSQTPAAAGILSTTTNTGPGPLRDQYRDLPLGTENMPPDTQAAQERRQEEAAWRQLQKDRQRNHERITRAYRRYHTVNTRQRECKTAVREQMERIRHHQGFLVSFASLVATRGLVPAEAVQERERVVADLGRLGAAQVVLGEELRRIAEQKKRLEEYIANECLYLSATSDNGRAAMLEIIHSVVRVN